MKIEWTNPKKYLWPLNVLTFNFYRLLPFRDKKIWIFGAWEGRKYDDNTKALFEYVNEKYGSDIRCVWLTNEQKTVNIIKSLGYEAYTSESPVGKKMQKKAGVAIYTNGVMDFGLHPKIAGALIVSLWHGVGFKKTYNEKYHGLKLIVKKTMDIFFSWTYRNVTFGTSQYVLEQFRRTFGLKKNAHMAITGQPRNDIFKKNLRKNDILQKLKIDFSKRIILYMPTYRSNGMPHDSMNRIVQELYDNETLRNTIQKENFIFIAKLHPLCSSISVKRQEDFLILNSTDVDSVQELLAVSDILVTDYSSCIVDFALQEKPVIFYTPDHEQFVLHSEPLFDEYYEIRSKNNCSTPEELSHKLEAPSLAAVDTINKLFEAPQIKGTCYSENVYQAIIKYL